MHMASIQLVLSATQKIPSRSAVDRTGEPEGPREEVGSAHAAGRRWFRSEDGRVPGSLRDPRQAASSLATHHAIAAARVPVSSMTAGGLSAG